ncbi:MAG: DUF192 domain-containing protein [Candidatus Levyibacteriota bacterium]
MKKIFALVIILLGILLGIVVARNYLNGGNSLFPSSQTATINDHKFKLDVASTDIEKENGLSNKTDLPADQGMLFIFDKPDYYSFWMKNMKFPIDIIFIRDGTVVTIYNDVAPPAPSEQNPLIYQPKSPADMVLEINAGLSSKYGFKEGDKIKLGNI